MEEIEISVGGLSCQILSVESVRSQLSSFPDDSNFCFTQDEINCTAPEASEVNLDGQNKVSVNVSLLRILWKPAQISLPPTHSPTLSLPLTLTLTDLHW